LLLVHGTREKRMSSSSRSKRGRDRSEKKGEPELFVLLFCFAGDWEVHRRYGREEKETIPIYQPAGLHWPPVA
jgi:hypothetical protein